MNRHLIVSVVGCFLLAASPLRAQTIEITLEGGKQPIKEVPVCVPLSLTEEQASRRDLLTLLFQGKDYGTFGQLTAPGILTEHLPPSAKGLVRRDLHFVLGELQAGEKLVVSCKLDSRSKYHRRDFNWVENEHGFNTLERAGASDVAPDAPRPFLRYMRAAYDNSSAEKRNRTYKVFHHLFEHSGNRLVTNGGHTDPYTDEKTLLYPHHRGLMYAFNKIAYGEGLKLKADTWHAMPGDTHQEHDKILFQEAGFVLGRHRVQIKWCGAKSDVFAIEERELTVYDIVGGTLVEFASRLKTTGGKVRLDGDPQHAGFQFRAANEVAGKESAKQTYYLRPDGKGEMGATRNWDPKTREGPVNLPWDAMSFVLGGKRYTVAYLNSPQNPKESRFSERDYGRFGCYFEYDLTAEHPLVVNYRVWLQDGEMTGDQVAALYEAFAHPPRIIVKK